MKSFFFLLSLVILSTACGKLEKFSTNDAISVLELMDKIEKSTNDTIRLPLVLKFEDLTGMSFSENVRQQLYIIINKNMEHNSIFSKMLGLISFREIILVCMVIVGIAFLISFMLDILFFFGPYVGYVLHDFFFTKKSLYIQGLGISFVTLYFKVDEIENKFLRYLFIFDWLTPLFGCLVFYIVMTFMYADYTKTNFQFGQRTGADILNKDIMVNIVWSFVAIYHRNWIVATLVIIMFFIIFGFTFGSTMFGYYSGFNNNDAPQRCIWVSIILNAAMIMIKIGYITGAVAYHLSIFETGVFFWALFVGSVAFLIISDEYYLMDRYNRSYNLSIYLVMQALMGFYCMTIIYLGNILYIIPYQGIGGTFFVLWLLNLERTFLMKFKRGSVTILLFIILTNLFSVKQLITWYPEYFIF